MCNLYSKLIMPSTLRAFFEDMGVDLTEPSLTKNYEPGYVGADSDGPVIRWTEENTKLEIADLRWGFPPAPIKNAKRKPKPITNIRNLGSRWWKDVNREYLTQKSYRCLMPFDRFSEWDTSQRKNAWFKVRSDVSFFAGVWRPWTGERLKDIGEKRRKRTEDNWELYSFLTTEANGIVKPIHPKAMPVIFTEPADCKAWLNGDEATSLQRPLPDEMLERVTESN